ncbi:MAG TPA: hypothetical protein VKF41_11275 [Bryobacteraceae bacterium]|nr:hypothetical protein [Bryobacteraceae bacterium]
MELAADGDRLVATGETRHVFIDAAMQKARCPVRCRAPFGMGGDQTAGV